MQEKKEFGQGFKLVVGEEKVNSSVVPVAFCVSKDLIDKIGIEKVNQELIYVFIKVASEREVVKRYAVPLKDMYIHLPMIGIGVNTIEYSLVEQKKNSELTMMNIVGEFINDSYMGDVKKYDSGNIKIDMPKEYFDKDSWFKVKARKILDSTPVNGCKARLEIIKSIPVLVSAGIAYLIGGFLFSIYGMFILLLFALLPLIGQKVDLKDFYGDMKILEFYTPKLYISEWFDFKLSPLMIVWYLFAIYGLLSGFAYLKINLGDIFLFLSLGLFSYLTIKYLREYYLYIKGVKSDRLYNLRQSDEYKKEQEKQRILEERIKRKLDKKAKKQKAKEKQEMRESLLCNGSSGSVKIPEPKMSFLERKRICLPVSY